MDIKNKIKDAGISLNEMEADLQKNSPAFVAYAVAVFVLMFGTALAVFFFANKGYEQVLVPDVTGKSLTRALLEMQEKELYPKLQLRYSDLPGQAGQVLSQNPRAGSIVKAGRRVTLVVSRGVIIDHIGNYVGTNLDALKNKLDALYGGVETPQITIANPVFKMDAAPIGTILEQEPPEGTPITQPVELQLIVSSGPTPPRVSVQNYIGKTIAEILEGMGTTPLLFEFTSHVAKDGETPGTVVSQSEPENSQVGEYSKIALEFALPELNTAFSGDTIVDADIKGRTEDEVAGAKKIDSSKLTNGIFSAKVSRYPLAVPVKLEAFPPEGASYTIASFNHIGGEITVPYAVPHGTTLALSVLDQEKERLTVQ